jgi:NADH:ubiquinone oxidoreductase subunit K
MNHTQNPYKKGFKYIFGAIPLFFLAPIVINIGFSAIKKDKNYIFITIGGAIAFGAIALVFTGIKHLLNALFEKDKKKNPSN